MPRSWAKGIDLRLAERSCPLAEKWRGKAYPRMMMRISAGMKRGISVYGLFLTQILTALEN
jgi:hypothetical protein